MTVEHLRIIIQPDFFWGVRVALNGVVTPADAGESEVWVTDFTSAGNERTVIVANGVAGFVAGLDQLIVAHVMNIHHSEWKNKLILFIECFQVIKRIDG